MIRRGEIWWADFGLPRGSAPALRRPALVVSADAYNASSLRTVLVVALTSNLRLRALPGNVLVSAEHSGLPQDTTVNVTQVATLDREALEERVGMLPRWLLAQVDAGLGRAFGLG